MHRIAVLGMTEFRPLPARRLEYSSGLIIRASRKISYGTVVISRSTFMEKRLLDILSLINARTTVIPLFSGVVDGVWQLQLTTWAEHQWRSSQKCKWEEVSEGAGFMKYRWQHRDGWKYEHEGSGEIDNGTYSILCEIYIARYCRARLLIMLCRLDAQLPGAADCRAEPVHGHQALRRD